MAIGGEQPIVSREFFAAFMTAIIFGRRSSEHATEDCKLKPLQGRASTSDLTNETTVFSLVDDDENEFASACDVDTAMASFTVDEETSEDDEVHGKNIILVQGSDFYDPQLSSLGICFPPLANLVAKTARSMRAGQGRAVRGASVRWELIKGLRQEYKKQR